MTRKDSYTPDADLENKVQEMLALEEMPVIKESAEQINGEADLATSPSEGYNVMDIRLQRSHTYRSSVRIKIASKEGTANGNVVRGFVME